MKSTQLKREKKNEESNNLSKNSLIAAFAGIMSWVAIFFVFEPLAGLYKFGKTYYQETLILLKNLEFYMISVFIAILFFLFFYLTLKYKQKVIMWLGIILYALFYLGYLFLLFFFRFTDL